MKSPEEYWINRGADLIGLDVLEQGEDCRQAATYRAIAYELIMRRGFSVLDVGCNVGALINFVYPRMDRDGEISYLGMDSNREAVKHCLANNITAVVGSVRQINMTADCVVVKDVLEHLESLEPAREAFRVASKAVILSFFMPPMPGSELIYQTEHGYFHNRYDENKVIELAHDCGFNLVKRIDTWEKDGNMNRTYVFERKA